MKRKLFVLLAGAVFLATPCFAGVTAGGISGGIFGGWYKFDPKENILDKPMFGIRLGYDITNHIGLDLLGESTRSESSKNSSTKIKMNGLRLEGMYNFMPDSRIVPFLAIGAGLRSLQSSGEDYKRKFDADWGFGAKCFVTDGFIVRLDVRQLFVFNNVRNPKVSNDFISKERNNYEAALGLSFYIPSKKKEEAPVSVVKPEVAPAPAPEPTPAPVVAPAPAPVVAPAPINRIEQEILVKGKAVLQIQFELGKANIMKQYDSEVAMLAIVMNKFPEIKVVIQGHTDNTGTKKRNQILSQQRADSVKDYLVKNFGIDPARLKAVGYGQTKPEFDNKTLDGQIKNRRVEAVVEAVGLKK